MEDINELMENIIYVMNRVESDMDEVLLLMSEISDFLFFCWSFKYFIILFMLCLYGNYKLFKKKIKRL